MSLCYVLFVITLCVRFCSLASNSSKSSISNRTDAVNELNRRNSALSASGASNVPYSTHVDTVVKISDINNSHLPSDYIPYGKTKNVTASSNGSQPYVNVMKGIPTITGSRFLFLHVAFMCN